VGRELAPLSVPVVTTLPLLFVPLPVPTVLVLVIEEVDIFVIVVGALLEVLTVTGREVDPVDGVVEESVV
jgi:hypothetical protein